MEHEGDRYSFWYTHMKPLSFSLFKIRLIDEKEKEKRQSDPESEKPITNKNKMKNASLETIAEKMKDLDFCMMITQDENRKPQSRPMSNNGRVEYDGDSWFFTYEDSNKVRQIKNDNKVNLIYQTDDLLFIECYGTTEVIKDKETLKDKWVDGLEQWFPEGVDTPGICLLKITAERVTFWHKEEEGQYTA